MAYSTIKKKRCKCSPDCKHYPRLGYDGYSVAHAPEEIKERQKSKTHKQRRAAKQRLHNKILKLKPVEEQEQEIKLDLWYSMQMYLNKKVCDNCGTSLEHYNDWSWRSSQNHIVDKSPVNGCPSIATHPLNHNVLGMWCCHGQWGTSFENQSKMPCFAAAKEKFQLFVKDIAPDELRKVNPYLFQTQPLQPSCPANQEQKQDYQN